MRTKLKQNQYIEILILRRKNYTYRYIGEQYRVSTQRIFKICEDYELDKNSDGCLILKRK